jgi:hypothetical protein
MEDSSRHSLDGYMINSSSNNSSDDDYDDKGNEHRNSDRNSGDYIIATLGTDDLEDKKEVEFFVNDANRTRNHHPSMGRARSAADQANSIIASPSRSAAHSCRFCGRTFTSESVLASHLFQQHAAESDDDPLLRQQFVKCPQDGCCKAFRRDSSAALRNHVLRSHGGQLAATAETPGGGGGRRNECVQCGKTFKNVHFLRKHISGQQGAGMVPVLGTVRY